MTAGGFNIVYTQDEVDFVQNLVFYIERKSLICLHKNVVTSHTFENHQVPIVLLITVFGREVIKLTMDSQN